MMHRCTEWQHERATTMVAHVGEAKITQRELNAAVKVKNAQAFYDARRAVLEELRRARVLKSETEARGITEEALFAVAVKDISSATDTEIAAFFINGRFLNGAQPFEMFAQIIDEELRRSRASPHVDAIRRARRETRPGGRKVAVVVCEEGGSVSV